MSPRSRDWCGQDVTIWWDVCRRFDAKGVGRFALLTVCEAADNADYQLMLERARHRESSTRTGFKELKPARYWFIRSALMGSRSRIL